MILHHPDRHDNLFARVKVPEVLARVGYCLGGTSRAFIGLSVLHDLIRYNLDDLFPDMAIVDVMLFRVTRNADLERDEEEAEDLLELMEEELRQRRFAKVVRLEYGPNPNPWILDFLHARTASDAEQDVYRDAGGTGLR